jgi:hypothetical protein
LPGCYARRGGAPSVVDPLDRGHNHYFVLFTGRRPGSLYVSNGTLLLIRVAQVQVRGCVHRRRARDLVRPTLEFCAKSESLLVRSHPPRPLSLRLSSNVARVIQQQLGLPKASSDEQTQLSFDSFCAKRTENGLPASGEGISGTGRTLRDTQSRARRLTSMSITTVHQMIYLHVLLAG